MSFLGFKLADDEILSRLKADSEKGSAQVGGTDRESLLDVARGTEAQTLSVCI